MDLRFYRRERKHDRFGPNGRWSRLMLSKLGRIRQKSGRRSGRICARKALKEGPF